MIERALFGKLSIAGFVFLLAIAVLKFGLRQPAARSASELQEWREKTAPAAKFLTADHLAAYPWRYDGPIGDYSISFEPGGALEMLDEKERIEGTWFIDGSTIYLKIKDGTGMLIGFLVDDPEQIRGFTTGEGESESDKWTATRTQPIGETGSIKSYHDFRRFLLRPENTIFGKRIEFNDPWIDGTDPTDTLKLLSKLAEQFPQIIAKAEAGLSDYYESDKADGSAEIKDCLLDPWIDIDEFSFEDGPPFKKWSINYERSDWPKSASYGGSVDFSVTEIIEIWSGT